MSPSSSKVALDHALTTCERQIQEERDALLFETMNPESASRLRELTRLDPAQKKTKAQLLGMDRKEMIEELMLRETAGITVGTNKLRPELERLLAVARARTYAPNEPPVEPELEVITATMNPEC
jgi:hypothetical protein